MSKSLGNVIDPLDMIAKYGTDAVRLALLLGTTPGQDTKLSEEKIAGFRNFTNKLWNISRFILMQIGEKDINLICRRNQLIRVTNRWFLLRLHEVKGSVTKKIENYQFSSAGEELRDFTWGDLADWYLEIAKIEKHTPLQLAFILKNLLVLWHPFMPFVTEHIWQIAGFGGYCMQYQWPKGGHSR